VERCVLAALQRMFAALQSSKRSNYDPLPFCAQFKDRAGTPVDPNIQMDAQQCVFGAGEGGGGGEWGAGM
jgi:hypothetical protein